MLAVSGGYHLARGRSEHQPGQGRHGVSAMWLILLGSAAAIILLGLGVLEVMSARVRFDPPCAAVSSSGDAPTQSSQDFLNAQGDLPNLELGPTADRETAEPMHFAVGEGTRGLQSLVRPVFRRGRVFAILFNRFLLLQPSQDGPD